MLKAHQRRITWITAAALLVQVFVMTVHHVVHGTLAPPGVLAQADLHEGHDHHTHDGHTNDPQDASAKCPFWAALQSGANYVPPLDLAASVPPSPPDDAVGYKAPLRSPLFLLTSLSSRGPPPVV